MAQGIFMNSAPESENLRNCDPFYTPSRILSNSRSRKVGAYIFRLAVTFPESNAGCIVGFWFDGPRLEILRQDYASVGSLSNVKKSRKDHRRWNTDTLAGTGAPLAGKPE